jgi:hypothetical protein
MQSTSHSVNPGSRSDPNARDNSRGYVQLDVTSPSVPAEQTRDIVEQAWPLPYQEGAAYVQMVATNTCNEVVAAGEPCLVKEKDFVGPYKRLIAGAETCAQLFKDEDWKRRDPDLDDNLRRSAWLGT